MQPHIEAYVLMNEIKLMDEMLVNIINKSSPAVLILGIVHWVIDRNIVVYTWVKDLQEFDS